MIGLREFRFVGCLVQKTSNHLLVFVPDQLPEDNQLRPADEGVFLTANLSGRTSVSGSGADKLDPGRLIYGEGELTVPKDQLPAVGLGTLLVFWRKLKIDNFSLPPHLLEIYYQEVGVRSHLRKLPKGKKATQKQRLLAAKEGIFLPRGYTYVKPHTRKQEKAPDESF